MSSDRFVTWLEKKPTKKMVEENIAEFFGTGFPLRWDKDRWFIFIPGSPFCQIYRQERFVEVIPMKRTSLGNLDVLTRQGDPLVNALADGLVRFLCFRLQGDTTD